MHRQLRLDTSVGGNQRYSFIETPLEMHASGIRNGQQQQEIPPSQPLTVPNPDTAPAQAAAEQEQPQRLPLLNEKAQYVRQEAVAPGNLGGPNPEEHPAISAPYADAVPQPVQQHDAVVPDYSYPIFLGHRRPQGHPTHHWQTMLRPTISQARYRTLINI
ncbi:unnamed protein product [Aspergillus oryzae RIB40]|uniref:DNA, SC113 n=1 Tax=Aspergillus oryzae (strain ATCC 42149 / RIB 40) TaxID=510516 RepID=Q2U5X7_ASPOR|nr:unnamed protein product [Aspergillus oryzae RIB40]BAE63038.1 unnamed protein product [Aspergillus oryzae RIB40]